MKKLLLVAALAAIAPLAAQAESKFVTGGSNLSASANLDFSITIPKVLFLQVGTGSSYTDNATVDAIGFNVPAGSVGNNTAVAGTGGDLSNGSVTVRVLGNSGAVTLVSGVTGPLSSGVAGNPTVPWTDINVTAAALTSTTPNFDNSPIAHPAFGSAGTTLTATGGLVRREGSWTFAYANTAMLPGGTYGTSSNGGRVTYTASAP